MDIDPFYDMPGGENFDDVTDLLKEAAKDLGPEELLLTEGFTLMDAMSAFEIGEPRMDSGMTSEQDTGADFDPLAPLLPEELCWMLDRTFACEMEWYAGNTLSQSVFTFLYIHQLADINPDLLPPEFPLRKDPLRPIELVTVVLRSAVFGLLKSCDLVWRELSRKRVYDIEDWQSDKCDVTLLEGLPVDIVMRKLDDATVWLRHSSINVAEREAICDRLSLRKTLLELFKLDQADSLDELRPLVTIARSTLRRIKSRPSTTPQPNSPALDSFDPRVTRRLHTIVPIRVLELPSQEVVWQSVEKLLDGWDYISHLREVHSLWGWKIAGLLSVWGPDRKTQLPYIRSLTQSAFSDHNMVLGEYPMSWLVDRFFQDTLGIPWQAIVRVLPETWVGRGRWTVKEVEKQITQSSADFIKISWWNLPRRRRAMVKIIPDWQLIHEGLLTMASEVIINDRESAIIATSLPKAAVLWKLTIAQEIVLSGFQLQLYAPHERSVAYWYLAHILEQHLDCLESLRSFVPSDSLAYDEMVFQSRFLGAVQLMSIVMCAITARDLTQSMERMTLNFYRRYKWIPSDDAGQLLLSLPPFSQFPWDLKTLSDDTTFAPHQHLKLAKDLLLGLHELNRRAFYGSEESDERNRCVSDLTSVAEQLATAVRRNGSAVQLEWDPAYHPWFPRCLN